jgi:hypothetical protein
LLRRRNGLANAVQDEDGTWFGQNLREAISLVIFAGIVRPDTAIPGSLFGS